MATDNVTVEPSNNYRPSIEERSAGISRKEASGAYTQFLIDVLELGDRIRVRQDLTVVYTEEPNRPIEYVTNKLVRPLVVITNEQVEIPNALFIDPGKEGSDRSETIDKAWFYDKVGKTTSVMFANVMNFIMEQAIKVSQGKENEIDPAMIRELSLIAGKVDSKSKKEFDKLANALPAADPDYQLDSEMLKEVKLLTSQNSPREFFSLVRVKGNTFTLFSTFLNDKNRALINKVQEKIRKKTWSVFEEIVSIILRCPNKEMLHDKGSLFFTPEPNSKCPTLESFTKALMYVWNGFIPYLANMMGDDFAKANITRIKRIEDTLPKLSEITNAYKWAHRCGLGPKDNGQLVAPDIDELQSSDFQTQFVRGRGRISNDDEIKQIIDKNNIPETYPKIYSSRKSQSTANTNEIEIAKTSEMEEDVTAREEQQQREIENLKKQLEMLKKEQDASAANSSTAPAQAPASSSAGDAQSNVYSNRSYGENHPTQPDRYDYYRREPDRYNRDADRYDRAYERTRIEERDRYSRARTSGSIYSERSYGENHPDERRTQYASRSNYGARPFSNGYRSYFDFHR